MENKSLQAGQGARLPPGCLRASACPTLPTSFHAFSPPQPSRFSPPIPRSGSGVALPIDTTDVNAPNFLPPSPQTHLPHLSCQDGGNTSSDPLEASGLGPHTLCVLYNLSLSMRSFPSLHTLHLQCKQYTKQCFLLSHTSIQFPLYPPDILSQRSIPTAALASCPTHLPSSPLLSVSCGHTPAQVTHSLQRASRHVSVSK